VKPEPIYSRRVPQLEIREVGPRDGLQNEEPLNVERRAEIISALCRTGLRDIEAVSFVSPKAVPAMAHAADVLDLVDRRSEVRLWALVPNVRGALMAVDANVDAMTVTVSACPVYNEKNVRQEISESVTAIGEIVRIAGDRTVDVVISCVFGSPYTGDEPTRTVPDLMGQLSDLGVNRFTLADTTGMATPYRVERVLHKTGVEVGLHLHDTRGTALVNAKTAIDLGVTRFDTAVGGLGGSPFAKGAGGNLATEDLVHMVIDDPTIETGIDLGSLLAVAADLATAVDHALPGRVATHGPAR
jgi:hydroxymethylglutaryl-CoA lyase